MTTAMTTPLTTNYLCLHWFAASLYVVAFGVLLLSRAKRMQALERAMAFVLVVGPALYYPIAFFALRHVSDMEGEYVKLLAEVWGPFWAAASAFYLLVLPLPAGRTRP